MTYYRRRIFDFDDWNNHAVANYRPYLMSDSLDASISASWQIGVEVNLDNLGGRIIESLTLYSRTEPYVIKSDLTIMPQATLHIHPDVIMEFSPNVGILVLGTLKAIGMPGHEIIMRPIKRNATVPLSVIPISAPMRTSNKLVSMSDDMIRLCKDTRCSSSYNEGTN